MDLPGHADRLNAVGQSAVGRGGVTWPGHAVLQLPVATLDGFVRSRYLHYDSSLLGSSDLPGQGFVHAHVTVLGPFDEPPDEAPVRQLAGAARPFVARFQQVATFPNGIIHAVPDDPAPFHRLSTVASRVFPAVRPYRGEFAVAPHVTLDAVGPFVDEGWVRGEVSGVLGRPQAVDVLDVVWYQPHRTRLLGRWRLGGASPAGAGPRGPAH